MPWFNVPLGMVTSMGTSFRSWGWLDGLPRGWHFAYRSISPVQSTTMVGKSPVRRIALDNWVAMQSLRQGGRQTITLLVWQVVVKGICHRFYPQSCTCYMRSHLFHRHQFAIHLIGITMLLMHIILLHVFPPWLVYCLSSFKPFNPTRTHSGLKLLLLDSDETQNLMNYRLGFQKFKMFLAH